MINYKHLDLTEKANNQLKEIIIKLVKDSFKGSYYLRAIECIKKLRETCDETDELDFFNDFLENFLKVFPKDRYVDLWRLIINNKITLISNRENPKSKISEEEAITWLSNLDKKQIICSKVEENNDLVADID